VQRGFLALLRLSRIVFIGILVVRCTVLSFLCCRHRPAWRLRTTRACKSSDARRRQLPSLSPSRVVDSSRLGVWFSPNRFRSTAVRWSTSSPRSSASSFGSHVSLSARSVMRASTSEFASRLTLPSRQGLEMFREAVTWLRSTRSVRPSPSALSPTTRRTWTSRARRS